MENQEAKPDADGWYNAKDTFPDEDELIVGEFQVDDMGPFVQTCKFFEKYDGGVLIRWKPAQENN